MQKRKIPMRMCLGCHEMKPKAELVRVVKDKENTIFLDLTGKANGRGAYICKNVDCLKKARKSKAIERAFSSDVSEEIYDRMEAELKNEQAD